MGNILKRNKHDGEEDEVVDECTIPLVMLRTRAEATEIISDESHKIVKTLKVIFGFICLYAFYSLWYTALLFLVIVTDGDIVWFYLAIFVVCALILAFVVVYGQRVRRIEELEQEHQMIQAAAVAEGGGHRGAPKPAFTAVEMKEPFPPSRHGSSARFLAS